VQLRLRIPQAMCPILTRSFPYRDVSSARGETELDDVGNGELLEELSTLRLKYPYPDVQYQFAIIPKKSGSERSD
jgi:hypothetical protein